MPITEDQMSEQEMKQVVANPQYKCGECGAGINLAWGGSLGYDGYIIRCAKNVEHSTISKYNREREEYMTLVKRDAGLDSTSLEKMSEAQMLVRVGQAKFPQELKPDEKKLLAIACVTYGFDPIMHELSIYQGNPYVSIDGRYRKAQETGRLDGVETRPATQDEKSAWQIPGGDYFFRAEVYVKGSTRPFVGWGRVRKTETEGKEFLPVVNNPQRMAEKRAEAQALRKAFHIPLPSAEYIGSGEDVPIDADFEVLEEKAKRARVEAEPLPEPTPEATEPTQEASEGKTGSRDLSAIHDLPGFHQAVFDDFGIQPAESLKILDKKTWTGVVDSFEVCYNTIMNSLKKE